MVVAARLVAVVRAAGYRYVTLGFGNKISRLAVLTDASSVDGEWNSGRMLPELTQHGAGALTSSKYFGKSGIDALSTILHHADRYGLKWVFHISPPFCQKIKATPINAPQIPPRWQGLMWGTLPIGTSILAMLLVLIPAKQRIPRRIVQPASADENLVLGRLAS